MHQDKPNENECGHYAGLDANLPRVVAKRASKKKRAKRSNKGTNVRHVVTNLKVADLPERIDSVSEGELACYMESLLEDWRADDSLEELYMDLSKFTALPWSVRSMRALAHLEYTSCAAADCFHWYVVVLHTRYGTGGLLVLTELATADPKWQMFCLRHMLGGIRALSTQDLLVAMQSCLPWLIEVINTSEPEEVASAVWSATHILGDMLEVVADTAAQGHVSGLQHVLCVAMHLRSVAVSSNPALPDAVFSDRGHSGELSAILTLTKAVASALLQFICDLVYRAFADGRVDQKYYRELTTDLTEADGPFSDAVFPDFFALAQAGTGQDAFVLAYTDVCRQSTVSARRERAIRKELIASGLCA